MDLEFEAEVRLEQLLDAGWTKAQIMEGNHMSFKEIAVSGGSGGRSVSPIKLLVSDTGRGRQALTVTLTSEVMADCRWVSGDRVVLLYSAETQQIAVERRSEGWTLSPSGYKKPDRVKGRPIRCRVSISASKLNGFPLPQGPFHIDEWIIEGNRLIFDYDPEVQQDTKGTA